MRMRNLDGSEQIGVLLEKLGMLFQVACDFF